MNPWIELTNPNGKYVATVLACLPAGASRNHYKLIWQKQLSSVRVLELPPIRQLAGDPYNLMASVAERLRQSDVDLSSLGIFGHSLGGTLALAMATVLMQEYDVASRIILSGVPKPLTLSIDPASVGSIITESISEHSANGYQLPATFTQMIQNFVKADLEMVSTLSNLAKESTSSVAGFLVGNRDPLCGEADISWWKTQSPGMKVHKYTGGHFGYMDHQISEFYRSQILALLQS